MEFVIERDTFRRALERVQGIVDRRNTIPLLANVLIQTVEGGIKLTASDMEIAFTAEYEADVMSAGETTLNAKQLHEIVGNLPLTTVHLKQLENEWMEITSGKAYFKIVGLSPDGYPAIPEVSSGDTFYLNGSTLKEMIEHVYFSIATDDSRYGLNGAFLEQLSDEEGGGLRMISTDGHRLSLINCPFTGETRLKEGYLLPRKGLAELKKLCDEFHDADVEVSFSANSALFRYQKMVFFMRLLEGDFPDYRQVIPSKSLNRFFVSREEFTRALRRVSILSSEKTHSVRFSIHDDILEISASNPDLGESRETVEIENHGVDLSIGFNARYFLDALGVLSGERVILELGESLNPGILREEGGDDVMYVIMPMRLE